jgi:hypothetical protein
MDYEEYLNNYPAVGSITVSGSDVIDPYYMASSGAGTGYSWATNAATTTARGQLRLEGEEADLLINDKSLTEWMSRVEERLLILQPKPELLEQYSALKDAYEKYRVLEALCIDSARAIDQ